VIRREEHIVKQTRSYRYPGAEADHAIIIHPGAAADGGVPESFCAYHAARGVDVWRIELGPERGSPRETWVDATIALGEHVAENTGLPVFVMGASPGAAITHHALHASDVFWGAVQIAAINRDKRAMDTSPPLTNRSVSNSLYDAPAFTAAAEIPVVSVARDIKPTLYIVGKKDTNRGRKIANAIGQATGEEEVYRHPDDLNRLMWSPAISDIVRDWCLRQLSNHLNPKWNHARSPQI
jgi:hypothetical protein